MSSGYLCSTSRMRYIHRPCKRKARSRVKRRNGEDPNLASARLRWTDTSREHHTRNLIRNPHDRIPLVELVSSGRSVEVLPQTARLIRCSRL